MILWGSRFGYLQLWVDNLLILAREQWAINLSKLRNLISQNYSFRAKLSYSSRIFEACRDKTLSSVSVILWIYDRY
jgi:hypothetical protein